METKKFKFLATAGIGTGILLGTLLPNYAATKKVCEFTYNPSNLEGLSTTLAEKVKEEAGVSIEADKIKNWLVATRVAGSLGDMKDALLYFDDDRGLILKNPAIDMTKGRKEVEKEIGSLYINKEPPKTEIPPTGTTKPTEPIPPAPESKGFLKGAWNVVKYPFAEVYDFASGLKFKEKAAKKTSFELGYKTIEDHAKTSKYDIAAKGTGYIGKIEFGNNDFYQKAALDVILSGEMSKQNEDNKGTNVGDIVRNNWNVRALAKATAENKGYTLDGKAGLEFMNINRDETYAGIPAGAPIHANGLTASLQLNKGIVGLGWNYSDLSESANTDIESIVKTKACLDINLGKDCSIGYGETSYGGANTYPGYVQRFFEGMAGKTQEYNAKFKNFVLKVTNQNGSYDGNRAISGSGENVGYKRFTLSHKKSNLNAVGKESSNETWSVKYTAGLK